MQDSAIIPKLIIWEMIGSEMPIPLINFYLYVTQNAPILLNVLGVICDLGDLFCHTQGQGRHRSSLCGGGNHISWITPPPLQWAPCLPLTVHTKRVILNLNCGTTYDKNNNNELYTK